MKWITLVAVVLATGASADSWKCGERDNQGRCLECIQGYVPDATGTCVIQSQIRRRSEAKERQKILNDSQVKKADIYLQRCFTSDDKMACDQYHAICDVAAKGSALNLWCNWPMSE